MYRYTLENSFQWQFHYPPISVSKEIKFISSQLFLYNCSLFWEGQKTAKFDGVESFHHFRLMYVQNLSFTLQLTRTSFNMECEWWTHYWRKRNPRLSTYRSTKMRRQSGVRDVCSSTLVKWLYGMVLRCYIKYFDWMIEWSQKPLLIAIDSWSWWHVCWRSNFNRVYKDDLQRLTFELTWVVKHWNCTGCAPTIGINSPHKDDINVP